jgi:hypothetical protein
VGAVLAGIAAFAAGAVGFGSLAALAFVPGSARPSGNPLDDLAFAAWLAAVHGLTSSLAFGAAVSASARWRRLAWGRAAFIAAVAGVAGYLLQLTGLALLFVAPLAMLLRAWPVASMVAVLAAPGLVTAAACLLLLATLNPRGLHGDRHGRG